MHLGFSSGDITRLIVLGKSSVSELHFFPNITTVIDDIIIKKGINYLPSDGKSTAKSVYYLHSRSVNERDIP